MKKIIIICIAFTMVITGCKRVDVKFTYSPTEPRAGQVVKFSNHSSSGEDWSWDFGDNMSSAIKNPSHTFRKAGTYTVTLMVDSAKYKTCSHTITVYDSIPTFVASSDSICHYTNVTLTANVYNPFSYPLTYEWTLPQGCELVSGDLDSKSICVYFKEFGKNVSVDLTITQNGKSYPISRDLYIYESKSPAIVMQMLDHTVMRQRMINNYLEDPTNATAADVHMLEISSDTIVTFNGVTFSSNHMNDIFPGRIIDRIQIDAMAQKWYITSPPDGLFVANFDGQNLVLIDANATGGVCVDAARNVLYWASTNGLKSIPLIKSKNNQFATTPELYNTLSEIDRIIVNNNYQ